MKKSIILILISASYSHAQAPQVYAELGGPSVAGINFDSRFSKKENGIGGRIGFGGFSIDGSGVLFIPVGINYLIGKPESKNYLELGAGHFMEGFQLDISLNKCIYSATKTHYMEHNFNTNKGDLKYILEEERRREKGEPSPLASKNKITHLYDCLRNWMTTLLLNKSTKQQRIRTALPVFIEMFC